MIWFDYSLLKYLPDPKRGEVINIGLIVFRNSGVDVRLLKNTTKVRVFDGVTSINELSRLKASIEDLCGKDVSAQVQHQRLKMQVSVCASAVRVKPKSGSGRFRNAVLPLVSAGLAFRRAMTSL